MSGRTRTEVANAVARRRDPRIGASTSTTSSNVVLYAHRRTMSSSSDDSSSGDDLPVSQRGGRSDDDESRFPLGDIKALEEGSKCAERVFHASIVGSPELFSRVPEAAMRVLSSSSEAIKYRSADTAIGSKRNGDISDALVLHVHVQWAQNTFAWPVMVASPEIHGRYYAGDNRGFVSLPGNHTFYSTNGLGVHRPTRSLTSGIIKRYGTYNEKDFQNSVTPLRRNRFLVDVGTVAHRILLENEQSAPERDNWYNMDRDFARRTKDGKIEYYDVPANLVKKAEKCFAEDVLASKPHVDMGRMTIVISRLFGEEWDAPYGYSLPGSKESADSRIKELGGNVTIALRIKYRLKKPIIKQDDN